MPDQASLDKVAEHNRQVGLLCTQWAYLELDFPLGANSGHQPLLGIECWRSRLVATRRRTIGVVAIGSRIVAFRGGIICVIAVGYGIVAIRRDRPVVAAWGRIISEWVRRRIIAIGWRVDIRSRIAMAPILATPANISGQRALKIAQHLALPAGKPRPVSPKQCSRPRHQAEDDALPCLQYQELAAIVRSLQL